MDECIRDTSLRRHRCGGFVESSEMEKEFEIQKLNLLAFPRNQIPKCALTGVTATVQLTTPHITMVSNKTEFSFLTFTTLGTISIMAQNHMQSKLGMESSKRLVIC
jgi:hypothetical protein